MTVKPSAYENIWIYSILIVVNLHVSVTFCGHLQGNIFKKDISQKTTKPIYTYEILSFKYIIQNIC